MERHVNGGAVMVNQHLRHRFAWDSDGRPAAWNEKERLESWKGLRPTSEAVSGAQPLVLPGPVSVSVFPTWWPLPRSGLLLRRRRHGGPAAGRPQAASGPPSQDDWHLDPLAEIEIERVTGFQPRPIST